MLRRFLIVPAVLALLLIAFCGSQAHAATRTVQTTPTRVDCSTPGVVSITVLDAGGLAVWCYTGVGHVDPGRFYLSLNTGQWHVTATVFTGTPPILSPFITKTIKLNPGDVWQAPSLAAAGISFDIAQ